MSERSLRDEVEAIFDQVKRQRAKLETPIQDEVEAATAQLCTEIGQLEERLPVLRAENATLTIEIYARGFELEAAELQLAVAREQIASLDPILEPENPTRDRLPGCSYIVWLTLGVGMSAAAWWLA